MESHLKDTRQPTLMEMTFAFAAAMLLIATGIMIFVYALFDQTRTTDIIFNISPSLWRVLMLFGGVCLVAAGGNLFVGKFWARAVGLSLATLALLGGLLHIESDPVLSVSLIVLNLGIRPWHSLE